MDAKTIPAGDDEHLAALGYASLLHRGFKGLR